MQTYTLILVEDDADICERLVQLIAQHDGFKLRAVASSVAEGLAALAEHQP